ncbi:MAG: MBL fold metallo-hydrolase [Ilumatobacteraceae bacterium]|jgi:alkyl sulfatase BDS1-like metallo-beta-lactamase superfamily hydrolase|nr:MBL fold metallo-hydrolase [Ilumatobacteraceae bacterium]MDP5068602.1 MBL fold metallo-hydrolase [Ilumatobacteraceae bacterium]
MADLLALSTRIVDSGKADEPVNRTSGELSEIAEGLAMVESFSHVVTWNSGDGLVCFDTSHVNTGQQVVDSIRSWSSDPFNALVYTHGHVDHVGGSVAFGANAAALGHQAPRVIGHKNVQQRFDRYRYTNDWNVAINARQFGGIRGDVNSIMNDLRPADGAPRLSDFIPRNTLDTTDVVDKFASMKFGDTEVEFHHGRGETDDHLWSWFPEKKWIASGDFVIWNFPNAGNPQKVQRWPIEWAAALRDMIAKGPELLLPAHGLPIAGKERIARVLDEIATALENLVRDVVTMMNAGETLNTIIHTVRVPEATLGKPYLRPLYDEPEFVVRNIWRLFGGWWDGAPSRLKPSPDEILAVELASLSGGADVLMRRAAELAASGDLRLACHLADFAGWAAPDEPEIHQMRAEIYETRRKSETSLMSKGIFKGAMRESEKIVKAALGEK